MEDDYDEDGDGDADDEIDIEMRYDGVMVCNKIKNFVKKTHKGR